MSDHQTEDVATAMKAVRIAHNDLKELRTSRHSIMPLSLSKADVALDKLSCNLHLLTGSSEALSIFCEFNLGETSSSAAISLSQALVHDMEAIAAHFRLMKPIGSDTILGDLNNQECENIAELVDRYDRTIFSALTKHNVCV
jgi:hypothetical protein